MITVGDILICTNNGQLQPDLLACPLILTREYEVIAMKRCRCGVVYVDIGLSLSAEKFDIVCDACARRFNDGIWWFDVKRFKKKPNPRQEVQQANEVLRYIPN
ncbi:MAG TPA: hypothetical protein VKU83_06460 [Puia sp.]|nr:hypothetical protein [Puia sp.]